MIPSSHDVLKGSPGLLEHRDRGWPEVCTRPSRRGTAVRKGRWPTTWYTGCDAEPRSRPADPPGGSLPPGGSGREHEPPCLWITPTWRAGGGGGMGNPPSKPWIVQRYTSAPVRKAPMRGDARSRIATITIVEVSRINPASTQADRREADTGFGCSRTMTAACPAICGCRRFVVAVISRSLASPSVPTRRSAKRPLAKVRVSARTKANRPSRPPAMTPTPSGTGVPRSEARWPNRRPSSGATPARGAGAPRRRVRSSRRGRQASTSIPSYGLDCWMEASAASSMSSDLPTGARKSRSPSLALTLVAVPGDRWRMVPG